MDSLIFSEQKIPAVETEASSTVSLLESGLNYIRQGHYIEGTAFLTLARERLLPNQVQLTAVLDALNQATVTHLHAQQVLHEASKRFAESDSEQQAQIAALQKLLPTLTWEIDTASLTRVRPRKIPQAHQLLQLLRPPLSEDGPPLPNLYITCFGRFEVRRFSLSDQPIDLCRNLKGQAILRYLIAEPKHRETVDMLMSVLWPEDEPEAALHKLRIAISALRCCLNRDLASEPGGGYILCKSQVYQLNPAVVLKTDVDEFLTLYQAGHQANSRAVAAAHYEKACRLYTGPFLAEDLYTDWSALQREELSKSYVAMCGELAEFNLETGCYKEAATWAIAILKVDHCDEEAHRQLMQAYAAEGRRSEALRQYQRCQCVLAQELGIQPMPETQKLFQRLLDDSGSPTTKRN